MINLQDQATDQIARLTAERDALVHDLDHYRGIQQAFLAENDALRAALRTAQEALEYIAESHDAGRHDGLPEPCPAHDDVQMWSVAQAALAAIGALK